MKSPEVSIIVPCYNQAQYLEETIKSVLAQTYTNWECLIINDGSPDNTEDIALKFVQLDKRIKYYKKDNGGLSSARNLGLEKVVGNYIQFLDADDLISKNKFQNAVELLNNEDSYDFLISNFKMYNELDQSFRPAFCNLSQICFSYDVILFDWDISFSIPIHCGFFKANLFKDFRFNTSLKAKEDWLMWLYVFRKQRGYKFIDSIDAIYRLHDNSMTRNKSHMYENVVKVFEHVFLNEVEEKHRKKFLQKINTYWMTEAIKYSNLYTELYNSTSFKVGSRIVKAFNWLKR